METLTQPDPLAHLRGLSYSDSGIEAWTYAHTWCGPHTDIAIAYVQQLFPEVDALMSAVTEEPLNLDACILAGEVYSDCQKTTRLVLSKVDQRIPGDGEWWYEATSTSSYRRWASTDGYKISNIRNLWWAPTWLCGSDYSGGIMVASNIEGFWDEYSELEGVDIQYAGYNTRRILIRIDVALTHDGIRTMLENLDGYPCLDEGNYALMKMDAEHEGWTNWARSEFSSTIERALSIDIDDSTLDSEGEDPLAALWYAVLEAENIDWYDEDTGLGIDARLAGEAVTLELLAEHKVSYTHDDDADAADAPV